MSPSERGRFDAQLNEVIEQVETKYGYRTNRQGQAGSTVRSEPAVDPEMIKEIESYYELKKLRDLSRNRGGTSLDRRLLEQSRPSDGRVAPAPESGNQRGK